MVSGFLTSPCDHSRIFSGLAREMCIAEKDSGSFGFSKKEKISRIRGLLVSKLREKHEQFGLYASTRRSSIFRRGCRVFRRSFDQLDVEAERLQLFDQDVEALRQPGLERVLTLDDGFV